MSEPCNKTTVTAGQTWVPTQPRTRQKPKTVEAVGDDPIFAGGSYVQLRDCRIALPHFLRWVEKYQAKVQP